MNFGTIVERLKNNDGTRYAREGWNGKDMFIYYVAPNSYPVAGNPNSAMKGIFADDMVQYNAYIALKGVDNVVSTWVPSITDLFAEDWTEVK